GTPAAAAAPAPVAQTPLAVGETDEREITVETTKVRAVFTNRGGRLRHWMLKEYKDDLGRLRALVPASLPPDAPTPFSLKVEDAAATSRLNDSFYRVSGVDGIARDGASKPRHLVFAMQ